MIGRSPRAASSSARASSGASTFGRPAIVNMASPLSRGESAYAGWTSAGERSLFGGAPAWGERGIPLHILVRWEGAAVKPPRLGRPRVRLLFALRSKEPEGHYEKNHGYRREDDRCYLCAPGEN